MRFVIDWEQLIFSEIANPHVTRALIAQTYAYLIMSEYKYWQTVNAAILGRYKPSGLEWIKKEAWKRVKVETGGTS